MKQKPIDQVVFDHMFPRPKPNEPQDFHAFLQKNLVNEIRAETTAYYGSLDSRESQYPGLDYSYQPHRTRLSRYTWHRRLFRAFDALGLTKYEISQLTHWEGTLWAKQRFEAEQGIKIRDTTGDCIHEWVPPSMRPVTQVQQPQEAVEEMDDVSEAAEEEVDDLDEDSDMEIDDSVGLELNRRLLATAAQRDSGSSDEILDEDFQAWLRKALEEGEISGSRLGDLHTYHPDILRNLATGNARLSGTVSRLRPARTTLPGTTSTGRYAEQDAQAFSGVL